MADTKHKTTLEIDVDARKAEGILRRLELGAKRVSDAMKNAGSRLTEGVLGGAVREAGGRYRDSHSGRFATNPWTARQKVVESASNRAGGMASAAGRAVARGGSDPLAPIETGVNEAQRLARSVPLIGGLLGGAIAGIGAMAFMGGRTQLQMGQRMAGARTQLGMARVMGGMGVFGAGSGYGYSAEESAAMQLQFAEQAGFTGPGSSRADIFKLSRSGIPLTALAQMHGLMAGGMGARNVDISRSARIAQEAGLSGSKAADFLGKIASATSAMAEQGITMNMASVDEMSRAIMGAGGRGMEVARVNQALMSPIASAKQRLAAPFQQLGEMAVLQQALSAGGGYLGAMEALEGMTPGDVRGGLISGFGRRMTAGYLSGSAPVTLARAVAAEGFGTGLQPLAALKGASAKSYSLSAAIAQEDLTTMRQIKDEDVIQLLKIRTGMRGAGIRTYQKGSATVQGAVQAVQQGVTQTQDFARTISEAVSQGIKDAASGIGGAIADGIKGALGL